VARAGDPRAFAFPRSFLHDERPVFSFSGLKTAVLYALRGPNEQRGIVQPPPALIADLAASFQEAVVDVLVAKTRQALEMKRLNRLGVGGGVAANALLRDRLSAMSRQLGVEMFIPPLSLCTDNAAMAGIALVKLAAGQISALDIDVTAGLVRPERGKLRVEEQGAAAVRRR
jgi:N6-L-threonylcarbamoyladenine synthase